MIYSPSFNIQGCRRGGVMFYRFVHFEIPFGKSHQLGLLYHRSVVEHERRGLERLKGNRDRIDLCFEKIGVRCKAGLAAMAIQYVLVIRVCCQERRRRADKANKKECGHLTESNK